MEICENKKHIKSLRWVQKYIIDYERIIKAAVSRQSSSFCFILPNYSPSIAMQLKVGKEITCK